MKILDLLLVLVVFLTTIDIFFIKKRLGSIKLLSSISIIVILCHVFLTEIKWQVVLLYGYPLYVLIYFSLLQVDNDKFKKRISKLFGIVAIIVIVFSVALLILLPVETLQAPLGDYIVGTKTIGIHDINRQEIYGHRDNVDRELRIQIWYPSDSNEDKLPEKWMIDGHAVTKEIAKGFNIFSFMLDHTENIYSHSYREVKVSEKESKFPLIILSHGWTSSRVFHTDLAERLASEGYIVVGIDHTYSTVATRLIDGQIVTYDEEVLPDSEDIDFLNKANILVDVYSEDIKFVIDYIEVMNQDDLILKGKINTDSIGLLGHSTGGGAGIKVSIEDERVDAVLGMDPWVEPISSEVINEKIPIPYLFFRSEEWIDGPNNINLSLLADEVIQYDGIKHSDFTMIYAFSSMVKYIGMTGENSGYEDSLIRQEIILDFFNSYLNELDYNLENIVNKYEYVNVINLK